MKLEEKSLQFQLFPSAGSMDKRLPNLEAAWIILSYDIGMTRGAKVKADADQVPDLWPLTSKADGEIKTFKRPGNF